MLRREGKCGTPVRLTYSKHRVPAAVIAVRADAIDCTKYNTGHVYDIGSVILRQYLNINWQI